MFGISCNCNGASRKAVYVGRVVFGLLWTRKRYLDCDANVINHRQKQSAEQDSGTSRRKVLLCYGDDVLHWWISMCRQETDAPSSPYRYTEAMSWGGYYRSATRTIATSISWPWSPSPQRWADLKKKKAEFFVKNSTQFTAAARHALSLTITWEGWVLAEAETEKLRGWM